MLRFIVKRDGEEKNIRYSGDAKVFKDAFEKIDLNKNVRYNRCLSIFFRIKTYIKLIKCVKPSIELNTNC